MEIELYIIYKNIARPAQRYTKINSRPGRNISNEPNSI